MKYYVPFDVTDESFNDSLMECARQEIEGVAGVLSVDLFDNAFGRDLVIVELNGALTEETIDALAGLGESITERMEEEGCSGWGEIYPEQAMPEWIQPGGKADAYTGGDIVFHGNTAYISQVDGNLYEPGSNDSGWEPVEFEFVWTD